MKIILAQYFEIFQILVALSNSGRQDLEFAL